MKAKFTKKWQNNSVDVVSFFVRNDFVGIPFVFAKYGRESKESEPGERMYEKQGETTGNVNNKRIFFYCEFNILEMRFEKEKKFNYYEQQNLRSS